MSPHMRKSQVIPYIMTSNSLSLTALSWDISQASFANISEIGGIIILSSLNKNVDEMG